jgi:hypothetical protein
MLELAPPQIADGTEGRPGAMWSYSETEHTPQLWSQLTVVHSAPA